MMWLTLGSALVIALMTFPAGCSAGSSNDAEYEAAMRRLQSQIEDREVTEGSFRGLSIGHSKGQSLTDLRAMGVQFVQPDLRDEIRVTRSAELAKLRTAPGLIVGAGDVVISFDDDEVVRVVVAPIFPEWRAMLEPTRDRD